jgi:branched-subunit amino acid transport protein
MASSDAGGFEFPAPWNVSAPAGKTRSMVRRRARLTMARMDDTLYATVTILGLAVITVVSRGFFLWSERDLVLPGWVNRGLRYAPLAALAAVVAPEVVLTQGQFLDTWKDARLFAVAAATLYYLWRRALLGTIVSGMLVLVPLKLCLGW